MNTIKIETTINSGVDPFQHPLYNHNLIKELAFQGGLNRIGKNWAAAKLFYIFPRYALASAPSRYNGNIAHFKTSFNARTTSSC